MQTKIVEVIKRYIKEIVSFIIGVLLTSIFFAMCQNNELKKEIVEVERPTVKYTTKVETKTDTIEKTIFKPQVITEEIVRVDTLREEKTIPITQREYCTYISTDSVNGEIRAKISGYNAFLDTLSYKLYIPTRTVINTVETQSIRYKRPHFNFMIGIGGGYGLFNKKADIFIGGVFGYTF